MSYLNPFGWEYETSMLAALYAGLRGVDMGDYCWPSDTAWALRMRISHVERRIAPIIWC